MSLPASIIIGIFICCINRDLGSLVLFRLQFAALYFVRSCFKILLIQFRLAETCFHIYCIIAQECFKPATGKIQRKIKPAVLEAANLCASLPVAYVYEMGPVLIDEVFAADRLL